MQGLDFNQVRSLDPLFAIIEEKHLARINKQLLLGNNCQTNIDECEPGPCLNGATCIDGIAKYTCECRPGFEGVNCEKDIDECEIYTPCQNEAKCIGN